MPHILQRVCKSSLKVVVEIVLAALRRLLYATLDLEFWGPFYGYKNVADFFTLFFEVEGCVQTSKFISNLMVSSISVRQRNHFVT